ncbi:MAG TPA: N-acetylneuraminate synthase family protein [Candidatus Methylomirabilis sp.]|nr:N-acetylneuraminate synthase family protein [Candidatus Methylomirabilis sp.]
MSKTIQIGSRRVGDDCPPYVIAEAAISHQGDFETAKRMVYIAHAMGCDAIKFQLHVLDNEMLRVTPQSDNFDEPLYDTLEKTNLSVAQHRQLKVLCESLGIDYLCTPFSAAAADILDEMGVIAFKTGSGELTNLPLQRHIAAKGRPMIVSTGMALVEEIKETVDLLKAMKVPFVLTHCVSAYPCPYNRVNLGNVSRYRQLFDVPVGLSDHSLGIYTALGAVALGACVIEKHYTLSKLQKGPDHAVSLEPYELGELVKGCRAVFEARGDKREIFPEEKPIIAWARESVVSMCDIKQGEVITKDKVWVKRPSPGNGAIPAKDLDKVIGKAAKVDIRKDRQILWQEIN